MMLPPQLDLQGAHCPPQFAPQPVYSFQVVPQQYVGLKKCFEEILTELLYQSIIFHIVIVPL